ncbi:MAG: hypothetical protein ACU0BB_08145 [Paracoccaceae bacterium]
MQDNMIHPRENPISFAEAGIAVRLLRGPAPVRFQVMGERSSSTNLTKRLMMMNTPLDESEVLGWKHGFPGMMAIPGNLLVVGVVRNAISWARSMHAKPWHTTPAMQNLEFSDFIRAPWDTIIDRPKYFPGAEKQGTVGHFLQYDRHPITGKRFASLFDLRKAKLQSLAGYLSRNCNFALLRAELIQAEPEATMTYLLERLGHPPPQVFQKVGRRVGSKFNASVESRPATPLKMREEDVAYMKSRLDLRLEAQMGYEYTVTED